MDPLLILTFIVLFMLSAFFSGTELALMSLPEHKLESLLKKNKFGSKSLKKIKENSDRLLITILIGNNLVNTFTAAFATSIAINLAKSGGLGLNEATAIGLATGAVTFLLLLFGEIIPKSIATKNASFISLLVAPIYKILMFLLYPIIIFLEVLIKFFSGKSKGESISGDDIESFIDMGKEAGAIEDNEHKKIRNILEFDETTVEEIMTPRVKIEALSGEQTVQEALDFYLTHTHSRIPIYTNTIDKIDYFITSRDLVFLLRDKKFDLKLKDVELKKVMKVPLNQSISKLFENFQKSHKIMAIAIDEYGGVAGLVTMEDIIEEVFGEIRDETDKEVDDITKSGKDIFLVESDTLIEDVLEKFHILLPDIGIDEKEFDGETLSYVLTDHLERFPDKGEVIEFDIKNEDEGEKTCCIQFKVIDIVDHKIGKVEVRKVDKNLN